jgi:hypothetical protein
MTSLDVILGTAAYLGPEQAKGLAADPTGGRGTASPYRDVVLSPDGKRVIYNVAR